MKQSQQDYTKLHQISRHACILSGIAQLLDWDHETYMPHGAAGIRAVQLETLAGIIHAEKTGKKFANALAKLIDIPKGKIIAQGLSEPQLAALRIWRRDYLKEKALPKRFVEEFTKLTSQAIIAWRDARKADAFHRFAPFLDKIISMSRKKADLLGYQNHPYDALLDLYEPEATTKDVSQLFTSLRKGVTDLLKKISKAKPIDDTFINGTFSHEKQLEFSKMLLQDMGYNMEHGRLDLATHPFSSCYHPTDSRITTRFHSTNPINCISTVLHEAGHALYDMGMPQEHYGSPLGGAISMAMHESQSRWWETRIGQSKPFWKHYLPVLKKYFPGKFDHISLQEFFKAINKVEPSFIRVEADEVTYPLHVILRFEMERDLIGGTLTVREIPEAWNAKMKELLGVTPKNNAEGCLQDVHWSMGGFGYFPSYTLGNLYASHLFKAFVKDHPDWEKRIGQGELIFIKEWLNQSVHKFGRQFSSQELLKKITGTSFTAQAYLDYLNAKYSDLYGFK